MAIHKLLVKTRRGHGARTRTARQRVTGAALPNQGADVSAVEHLRELDIGALRKGFVIFDERTEFEQIHSFQVRHDCNAMRVADG